MFEVKDKYYHQAKSMGYRARSVFKLKEIQEKFRIIRKGDRVLDLGAAPGSWAQYVAKNVGENGSVVAVDLQEMKPFGMGNVETYVYDVFSEECEKKLIDVYGGFDVLLSDMAPKTSGIKDKDQWLSVELCVKCLELADNMLNAGGNMCVKIFQGADFNHFWLKFKKKFKKAKIVKPKAVRASSYEVYAVGLGFKKD